MRKRVHIGKTISKAFNGLCKIREIRKFLHIHTTKTLVHSLVSSHLDYCNALLFGSPKYQLEIARVIFQLPKFDHITPPALVDLHWLPKLLLIVYKSLHNQAPDYINDFLSMKTESNYSLRSSSRSQLLHMWVSRLHPRSIGSMELITADY